MGVTLSATIYFGVPFNEEQIPWTDDNEWVNWEDIYVKNTLGIEEPEYHNEGDNTEWDEWYKLRSKALDKLEVEIDSSDADGCESYYIVIKGSQTCYSWDDPHTPVDRLDLSPSGREANWIKAIEEFSEVMGIPKSEWGNKPGWYLTARYW